MANFTGTLNTNEWYNGLFNAYRLVETFSDSLTGLDNSLAERYKTDGGMYRDQSVYTDMDILYSREWDPTDNNVLEPEMKANPVQQTIVLDKKRQIGLYVEQYLSKRAWMEEGIFDAFLSVVQSLVSKTRKVYEQRMVDVAIGTMETSVGKQKQTVDITTAVGSATGEEKNRLRAQAIAKALADLKVQLKDSTRDYNDYGFMQSFNMDDFDIIINADYYNEILKIDLPTIFHKEGLDLEGTVRPARYFGTDAAAGTADGTTHRAKDQYVIRVDNKGEYSATGTVAKFVFAGDILPKGTPLVAAATALTKAKTSFVVNGQSLNLTYYSTVHAYTADAKIICKITHKNGIKYMSSFETETEFWNPKNLTNNRYLTWMYSEPEHLSHYPLITLREA